MLLIPCLTQSPDAIAFAAIRTNQVLRPVIAFVAKPVILRAGFDKDHAMGALDHMVMQWASSGHNNLSGVCCWWWAWR